MAKKKPAKDEAKKPKKPAKKPAKPKAKPAKSTAGKAKSAKPKTTAKKPAKSAGKGAKAPKTSGSGKSKKPVKPKDGLEGAVAFMAPGTMDDPGTSSGTVGGAIATPRITSPLTNSNVAAGVNLNVTMTTNQTGLRYILELTDITPPPPPPPPPAPPPVVVIPVPVNFNIPAPGTSPFNSTIPGANLVAGHNYRLRVLVDPLDGGTPPNLDHAILINA